LEKMTKKQQDIILAACREFEVHGFAGTGMEQIADAAKVSKRTLYKYYNCKEAVFSAIISYLHQNDNFREWPEYDARVPVREQLEAVIRAMLTHLNRVEHIRLARIVISGVAGKPELGEILVQAVDFSAKPPFRWIKAAMEDGQLRNGDPGKALFYLVGLVRTVALWPRLMFCATPLSERELVGAATECADFFLAYYLAASCR